ncbi:phosphonate metabolism protein/1,5-bisphosphokinase (PRPP-forming) PhnN [Mesorhizobium sp. A556]
MRPPAFVAVVGPSGAGKDSLLEIARQRLANDDCFVFARRVVTRRADPSSEDHDCLDEDAFREAETAGRFCVTWRAHGLSYGLPSTLLQDHRMGRTVVANASRRALDAIASKFSNLHVVEITASPAALRKRLLARGRETSTEIEARLARALEVDIPVGDWTLHRLDNSGSLEDAADLCVGTIRSIASKPGTQIV